MAKRTRKLLSLLLTCTLVTGMLGTAVSAADESAPAHLPECGYECTHQHDDTCGAITYEDSTDPDDGYVPAQEEVNCPNAECTGKEPGHVAHQDAVPEQMGQKEVITEENCPHDCAADGCPWVCAEDCPVKAAQEESQASVDAVEAQISALNDMLNYKYKTEAQLAAMSQLIVKMTREKS